MHSVSLTTNLHVLCCNCPLRQSLKRWMTPFKQWNFLFIQQMWKFHYSSQFTVYYAQWSKKHRPLAAVNQMVPLYSCPQLCQKLSDFQNSFTTRLGNNSVTKMPLKVICNGFSQNWWKVVSSCLLQYKSIYVINFDKLCYKMLKSKHLVVFLYSYSSAHRHAWRHIMMCLFLFALLLRLDKKLFYPFSPVKSMSVWQKCYI